MDNKPKDLVVISGKGGTGKTSIVASFAALTKKAVLADCDVDAADLHLVLEPKAIRREKFSGGKRARIKLGHCTACGKCEDLCRFDAIYFDGPGNGRVDKTFRIDPIACEGCGVCVWFCAENAIEFAPAVNGEWYVSETRHGPMVHAKLGIAEENSGKLVSTVRQEAAKLAEQRAADLVLIVTEPTLSGLHDLGRVADVAKHFGIQGLVCINKWDLNPEIAAEIERQADERSLALAGRVRYDRAVTDAQVRKQSVVEYQQNGCAEDIRRVWAKAGESLRSLESSQD